MRYPLIITATLLAIAPADTLVAQALDEGVTKKDVQEIVEKSELEMDGSLDDAAGTTTDVSNQVGWMFAADARGSYSYEDFTFDTGDSESDDDISLRWRAETKVGARYARLAARLAGVCSTSSCKPDFVMQSSSDDLEAGQITLDELYLHWFKLERFNLVAGRMQTKFVARGGVFAKSLDRNNSNNLNVNWTDGIQGTFTLRNGWTGNLIFEYNDSEGSGSIRREPLDFSDDGSRVTTFVAIENNRRAGPFLQRGLDISYLPDSLQKDGTDFGRLEDYWAFVGRAAMRFPKEPTGASLRLSGELGYAPETQTNLSEGITGGGDTDGLAWNFTASIMNLIPRNSLGINYGRTGAGWLLSPQYANNTELFEVRYLWRRNRQLAVDLRARWIDELETSLLSPRETESFDMYLRVTWGVTTESPRIFRH